MTKWFGRRRAAIAESDWNITMWHFCNSVQRVKLALDDLAESYPYTVEAILKINTKLYARDAGL